MKTQLATLALVATTTMTTLSNTDETGCKIQSRWYQTEFLKDDGGSIVNATGGEGDAFLWRVRESDGGMFTLQNKGSGKFLFIRPDNTLSTLNMKTDSSDWILGVIADGWMYIQNGKNKKFLNIERRRGFAECDMTQQPTNRDRWSAQWQLVHVAGKPLGTLPQPGKIAVKSPAYGSDVRGDTRIAVYAPGFKTLDVKCWQRGQGRGVDTTIGKIMLDAKGNGTFTFPANAFPNGPLMIRFYGEHGATKDICSLQLYNTGGVKWNQGAPKDAPPQVGGMKLVYVDDFDTPLSISATGAGATYAAHKPGGGDFSSLPFTSVEKPNNPFLQRNTFLRIRADANKKSAGLISALRFDGTGITATAPCYFECSFVAQNAPGIWPAFWIMTTGVHKGLDKPADELDVIEAYGVNDLKHENQSGYWLASHNWNQPKDGANKQDGIYKNVQMKGALWHQSFNVYGVLVGLDDTVYYCNNVEMGRHKTSRLSKTEPFFFFINLATGGGWPVDLSRYDGIADMYIDYVRVYQGTK